MRGEESRGKEGVEKGKKDGGRGLRGREEEKRVCGRRRGEVGGCWRRDEGWGRERI